MLSGCSQSKPKLSSEELFVQFLNDEIPIINYHTIGRTVYFSDIDILTNFDEKRFYIVDMNGDAIDDFCYLYPASIDVIIYNPQNKCFELWLTEIVQQKPLGNKEMYIILTNSPQIFAHIIYDENAKVVKEESFLQGEEFDREKNESFMIYEINFEPVSEDEWKEKSDYLFKLIENAPKPISYNDLLSKIKDN